MQGQDYCDKDDILHELYGVRPEMILVEVS